MNPPVFQSIWTPADTAALRQLADEFPQEIGESAVLSEWVDREVPR